LNLQLILGAIIVAAVGLTVCLLLGYFGIPPFDTFTATVKSYIGKFDFTSVASNPASILAVAGTAAAVGVPLLNQVKNAKNKLTSTVASAKTEITGVTSKLNDAKTELTSTSLDLKNAESTIAGLQDKASTAQEQVAQLKTEKEKLLIQMEALNNIEARAKVLADGKAVIKTVVA
jgi:septal ring factor EnvC (AmiA/AmiB activator)